MKIQQICWTSLLVTIVLTEFAFTKVIEELVCNRFYILYDFSSKFRTCSDAIFSYLGVGKRHFQALLESFGIAKDWIIGIF